MSWVLMNEACFLGKGNSSCIGRCEIAQHVWRSMSSLESLGSKSRDSLVVQWLGLGAFSAGALASISGLGTNLPQAGRPRRGRERGNAAEESRIQISESTSAGPLCPPPGKLPATLLPGLTPCSSSAVTKGPLHTPRPCQECPHPIPARTLLLLPEASPVTCMERKYALSEAQLLSLYAQDLNLPGPG